MRTPKLLLVFLDLESCVIDRNTNFPGVHVKKVMQMKPTWRILLVREKAIPPVTDLEGKIHNLRRFQSIDYKAC